MIRLRELAPSEAQDWFEAMPRPQQVLSLSPRFAQADSRRSPGLHCVHLGAQQGGRRWLHSIHLQPAGQLGWAAISPYGYGGPLCNAPEDDFLAATWHAYQGWACERRVLGEFCRFHPETGQHRFFRGQVQFNRATVSVDLTLAQTDVQYNQLARRKIRRAAGVAVRWSRAREDWLAWGDFYRAAMAALGARPRFLFGDDYFAAIAAVPGVELCICSADGQWLSAGVYLFQQRRAGDPVAGTLEYHLGASSPAGHARGSAYLLQHAAAEEGRRRGLASLYLGGGTSAAADDPLLFYKRCFSRRERPFHIGRAVHHAALFAEFARARGYDPQSAPPNLLFD